MPSLRDDGRTVTLDLHGARVHEAEALADAALAEAAARGRATVKLIHGSSTSSTQYRNRTIKHAVQDLADTHAAVVTALRGEDVLTCALDVAAHTDPGTITMLDLT